MGAESSVFEDYDLDEPSVASKSTWTLRYGRFNDELDVTVLSEQRENKQRWSLLQKNVKFLKSLRHPCILKYLNVAEVSSELYLVIERCSPLPAVLDSLDPIEITTGIYNVLEALSFLHEQAGMCHNNICPDSVYVTSKGTWKIGELQHCCKFLEVTPEFLKNSRPFRNDDSISPEEKAEKLTITNEMGHTRDVFSFGVMAENLLEYLTEIGEMSKTFELLVQDKCLNPDPKQRPRIQTIMTDQLFSNDLLLITKFLSEVTLKSQKDKEEFFSSLFPRLANLSEEVIAKQLVHLLLSRFVLLETSASETIVPDILVPKRGMTEKVEINSQRLSPLLPVELYQKYVIPELFKMFHCHDYHIRMILLTYFSQFVDLFEKKDLEEVIFPQVLLGVRDCHEDLASLSLHCLAEMVKVLGRDTVIGGKSKQYFTKGTPKHLPKSSVGKESFKTLDKVLLKDLATYSAVPHTATNSCNVMDDKRQERQARLKEQRLARDQKRREQQQRRAERREQENKMPQVERAEGRIIRGSNSESPNPTINGCREIQDKDSPTLNEIPERKISSPFEEQDDSTFDVKVSKSWSDDRLDPEVYVTSDHSEDDWSDWGNNMEEQPSATPTTESARTKYSIEHMKKDDDIYNKSSPKNQPSSEKDITTHNTEHNEIQPLPKQNAKKALKLQSTKRKESPKNNQTLGAEYEIKSTGSLPEEAPKEIDFFADLGLTPVISKGKLSEQTVQREEVHSNKSSTGKTSNLLSYNLSDNNPDPAGWGEDTSGWGDDLNWAED